MTKEERDEFIATLTPGQRAAIYEILKEALISYGASVREDVNQTCRRQDVLLKADLGVSLLAPSSPASSCGTRPH